MVDAVLQHRDPLEAHAEGEARPLLGVVALDEAEHVRVDHAGAEDLDPARVLAGAAARAVAQEAGDVELDARLGEREEVRAQQDLAVGAEQLAGEVLERPLRSARDPPLLSHGTMVSPLSNHKHKAASDRFRACAWCSE